MGDRGAPSVFTIPPHRAFADALAEGLVASWGKDPMALARGIILVPNNRAAGAITNAFVRRAEGGLLLPRLIAIGDPELDERLGSALDPIGSGEPIPPAIDPMRRRLMLARLVQAERARAGEPVDAAEAVRLAAELARTLDQLLVECVDPRRLKTLEVAAELSEHWQKSLSLLSIILDRWPEELARIGRIDMAERRNRLLERVARRWREAAPAGFVVAAGITTSAPMVARVLRTVSRMENGTVVLPALDDEMPQDEWDALGPFERDAVTGFRKPAIETHPQFHLKLLLDRMDVARGEVRRWRWGGGHDASATRSRAISNAMKPAVFTGRWSDPDLDTRLTGIRALEVATPAEEAQAIAIALREALETPARTAALVTPDRALATRVSAHLRRWGIEADDSAGRPLSGEPAGTLLLALAEAVAEDFAPIALLALLKHPLVQAGEGRLAWLDKVRLLDLALRGPRPPAGLEGISHYLAGGNERERRIRARAEPGWREIRALLDPFAVATANARSLAALLAALRDAATAFAGDAAWSGAAGRAAAELVADLEAHAVDGPVDARPEILGPLLKGLMDEVAVRPPQGGHPRISIWGLLEARLQQSDLVILAGLNEGSWPALPAQDPWLAPRVRSELGLASLERRIGLSAHDFASALGAPQVVVTRARRDARAPAIASRFWLRMEAMDPGFRAERNVPGFGAWAAEIDRPAGFAPAEQPRPAPPVADRPKALSVTQVDRLKADPYAFYALKMLGLRALDPIDAEASAAWRGTAIHDVLERWATEDWRADRLLPLAREFFARPEVHPLQRAFWQPRVEEALKWIAEQIGEDRAAGRTPWKAEISGSAVIAGVELDGRVDRIDRIDGGGIAIIDYKTGKAPSDVAVREGFAMQLGLLGLIAERGGFEGVGGVAQAFEYWSLAKANGRFGSRRSPVDAEGKAGKIEAARFTGHAEALFRAAAELWLTGSAPFTAKLHPEYAPYADYDQLMRLDEWYGRGEVGDE
ncbi:double-strand break repair protein AddB [Sphingomonas sp. LaA6.9]|uniref:double-strand break repair protein AddB n=1 Tax=Sphingomonas sp. LaA6.9 TaxID=2919914 RepID=UPI001F501628|nr:double-strand break repair protein AddB [Sphingomonas sp. LaA6.9]MCJ8157870.1 double-strand break repair protein AddB [Sphingomonas sp. LaA6.9]